MEAAILAQNKKGVEGKKRALLAARLSREQTMFDKRFVYAQNCVLNKQPYKKLD